MTTAPTFHVLITVPEAELRATVDAAKNLHPDLKPVASKDRRLKFTVRSGDPIGVVRAAANAAVEAHYQAHGQMLAVRPELQVA